MARKGEKATKREAEAGKKNLEAWLKEHPSRGNLRHGAYSNIVKKKYSDARTREGKALRAQIDSLIADLEPLTPAQQITIARVAEKLIVVWQLSHFIETEGMKIIDREGKGIPCLNTHLRDSASLLRDLDLLYK